MATYSDKFLNEHRDWCVDNYWYADTIAWFDDMLAAHGFETRSHLVKLHGGGHRNEPDIFFEDSYGWDCWFAGYFLSSHQALREIGASRKDFPITYKPLERGELIEFKTLGDDERRRNKSEVSAEEAEGEIEDLPEQVVQPFRQMFAKEVAALEGLLDDWYRDVRNEFASILEDEYDWLTSDECIAEALEANDIVEEEDGVDEEHDERMYALDEFAA